MRNSAKTAMGGMIAALSLTIMLLTAVVPYLQYALPAMSGARLVLMVIEINKKKYFRVIYLLQYIYLTETKK